MPAKRLSMRKIRGVSRLKWAAQMSKDRIAASCGQSRSAVSEYLQSLPRRQDKNSRSFHVSIAVQMPPRFHALEVEVNLLHLWLAGEPYSSS